MRNSGAAVLTTLALLLLRDRRLPLSGSLV